MSFNLQKININDTSSRFIILKQDKAGFYPEKKSTEDTKTVKNKPSSSKKFLDNFTLISSAVIIGLPLLTSLKKGKKDLLFEKAQSFEQKAKKFEQTLQDAPLSNNKAPFIQKFGCFWDNLSKNHKEFTNNLIYGLGVIVVEPLIIFTSPFGHKKSSKKDRLSAITRLPITFLSGISFQYTIDKFFSNLIPKLSKKGFLGEEFRSLPEKIEKLSNSQQIDIKKLDQLKVNKTKLNTIKEITVFTFSLLTLPLGISLTNTLYGKVLKKLKFRDEKKNNTLEHNKAIIINSDKLKKPKLAFSGLNSNLAKEITENAGKIRNSLGEDFEEPKGINKKFYEWISKPIKKMLNSKRIDKMTSKFGEKGVDSHLFQKLLMYGILAKDAVRAFANATFNYTNEDIPYDQRLYLLFFHSAIAVPTLLIDIVAGFGAIKYQDKFIEKMLKKFKLSEAIHQRTKNGLKFFIPVAMATIVGKRMIAPAFATPISGVLKKKFLSKKEDQNKNTKKIKNEI